MYKDTIKGDLNLDLGASSYSINSLSSENDFVSINSNTKIKYTKEINNGSQEVNISNDFSGDFLDNKNDIDIGLNNKIPWNIDIDTGASSGNLNLREIKIQNLDLNLGAGNLEVDLGEINNTTYINIESGASKIVLNIPKDSGLKIEMDGALNSTNIDDLGLVENQDDVLISKDYKEKDTKFDIEVDMGVGNFKINRY